MMSAVRVKVCGIQTLPEALAAVQEGVDALGFVFAAGSRRRITPEKAAAISRELPPFVARVGVFVDEAAATVRDVAAYCGLDTLQFHGDETETYCRLFPGCRIIKAFAASPFLSVEKCRGYRSSAVLLDTAYKDKKGGGGRVFDWHLALPFSGRSGFPIPLILAGGLNANNIPEALEVLKPYAVDVSSGVEKNGLKDRELIRAFINQIRRWECQNNYPALEGKK